MVPSFESHWPCLVHWDRRGRKLSETVLQGLCKVQGGLGQQRSSWCAEWQAGPACSFGCPGGGAEALSECER